MALGYSDSRLRRTSLRFLLLTGTALSLGAVTSAQAQDATWLAAPGTNEFSTGTNWSTNTVPSGTGFFDTSTVLGITNSGNTSLGGITFNAGASSYTITNTATFPNALTFTGAGIVNNSGVTQTFINQGQLDFRGSSSAGNAFITNTNNANVELAFYDTATAGNATITNNRDLVFVGSSTAGNATITNNANTYFYFSSTAGNAQVTNTATGVMLFQDTSNAGTATFTNGNRLEFLGTSSAANATITNNHYLAFFTASTAGNATITNNNLAEFRDNSTAGNAVITNNATLSFLHNSTGGNATLLTNAGATTSFAGSTGPNGDGKLSAGSIAGAGSYVLGGNELTVGSNNASTEVSGVISGVGGSLVKTGAGMLTLSGSNTYSGGTTIAGGTVSVSAEANLGDVSGALTLNGGVLQVTGTMLTQLARSINFGANGGGFDIAAAGNTFTVAQSLAGPGSLSKLGAGTLLLTGANSYTGATTVAGGTLRAGSAGAFSSASTFTVQGGATLDLAGLNQTIGSLAGAGTITLGAGTLTTGANGGSTTFSGTIGGTGGLTKTGGGTFTLAGVSSYSGATTVAEGMLRAGNAGAFSSTSAFTIAGGAMLGLGGFNQTIGSLAGAGAIDLGTGTLTTGANGTSTSFSGSIGGTGGLVKNGAGTFTLTGVNSYTGATTVNAGKLVVNGALASTVTVNGGSLGGSGTVGGIVASAGSTIAPGNSIGTLTVNGNISFAAGSIYQVEVNAAGQGDRIDVLGMATLSGGTVQVLAENGNYAAATRYTILTAGGGVTGQFSGVTSNLAFLTPTLSYGAQNVTLTLVRNEQSFGPEGSGRPYIAATRNQGFIANAAERLGVGNPIYDNLISATAAEARAGFDLLSGEAHAQGVSVAIGESRLVREAVLGRLRGSLLTLPGGSVAAGFSADLPTAKAPVLMPAPRFDDRFTIWGEAVGAHANTDADGNAASLSRRTGGAILGADMKLYDSGASSLRVGVAGGYTRSDFDIDARLSSGRLESGHALIYAGARFGGWRLDGGLGYSFGETSLTRQVRIRGFGDTLRSERDTDLLQAFAELGYAFRFERFAIEPFAQLALLRVSSSSSFERGGPAALQVLSGEQNLGFTTLGLRAEAQLGAMPLFARGLLGWRYGFGELTPQATTGFVAGTTPARVFATQIDRNALVAEAGLDWRVSKATTVGLAYSAAIGERTRDHALKGRFEVRF